MKKILLLLLTAPNFIVAQTINTFCGTGTSGISIEGVPATASPIRASGGGVFDAHGNFYFCQGVGDSRISRVNTLGVINTIAGTGVPGYSGDGGSATLAQLKYPNYPSVDNLGNIYIPDANNNRIRKVNISTGIITTIAGTGVAGFNGDGIPATAAMISGPSSIDFDKKGNLYFADYNNVRIRKIDTSGNIHTITGTGIVGYTGDGGTATSAKINGGICIKFDAVGNLYIADQNNYRIRKIDTFGIITTVAGNGAHAYTGDEIPATNAQFQPIALNVDINGNLFIADSYNNMVRYVDKSGIIHRVAGTGISGYNGDGISATAAKLNWPNGVAIDTCGNVYILDNWNYRIRKVTFNPPPCTYLSVEEQSVKKEVYIYPNPVNDELHITSPGISRGEVVLCNMLGQVVLSQQLNGKQTTLNIKHLPPGLYLLALTDEEGKRTVHKIVKE